MGMDAYRRESDFVGAQRGGYDCLHRPQAFASLFDINRQTIALLVEVGAAAPSDQSWASWRAIGDEISQLDAAQQERLALCPFSLLDAGLRDVSRYPISYRMADGPAQSELPFSSVLLQTRLENLAQAVHLFAWHLVRSDVTTARLVFAMNSTITASLTHVTLTAIRGIAQEQVRHGRVRPQWHNRPEAWLRLIHMARAPHPEGFATVATRGLQLFLQELTTDAQDREGR